MKPKTLIHSLLFGLVLLACACFSDAQTVVPLGGLGAVQVFDNNGNECTACVLYTYQAGTVTQQATYTDFTAQTPNTNPVTFSSGGRSTVWLLSGAYYKFILCLQNDGAYCAPADVLFSVDQVLAGSGGSGGGGGSRALTPEHLFPARRTQQPPAFWNWLRETASAGATRRALQTSASRKTRTTF